MSHSVFLGTLYPLWGLLQSNADADDVQICSGAQDSLPRRVIYLLIFRISLSQLLLSFVFYLSSFVFVMLNKIHHVTSMWSVWKQTDPSSPRSEYHISSAAQLFQYLILEHYAILDTDPILYTQRILYLHSEYHIDSALQLHQDLILKQYKMILNQLLILDQSNTLHIQTILDTQTIVSKTQKPYKTAATSWKFIWPTNKQKNKKSKFSPPHIACTALYDPDDWEMHRFWHIQFIYADLLLLPTLWSFAWQIVTTHH